MEWPYATTKEETVAEQGNLSKNTFTKWRTLYQTALGTALDVLKLRQVGGRGITVVVDETVVGVHAEDGWASQTQGVNKGGSKPSRTSRRTTKKLVKKPVLKMLPARTIFRTQRTERRTYKLQKKPSACLRKKPSSATSPVVKKPAANLKTAGRWLWLAIETAKGRRVLTHADHTKRIAFRLLPRKADAAQKKPRGLNEITNTLRAHVAKGSMLVFDGWTSTKTAVEQLGYKHAPPVKHDSVYRDPTTGFHTNDAESENARLKSWSRRRYGRLNLSEAEMCEYVYYVNAGASMPCVLRGLAASN